jgi:hypothetical protein
VHGAIAALVGLAVLIPGCANPGGGAGASLANGSFGAVEIVADLQSTPHSGAGCDPAAQARFDPQNQTLHVQAADEHVTEATGLVVWSALRISGADRQCFPNVLSALGPGSQTFTWSLHGHKMDFHFAPGSNGLSSDGVVLQPGDSRQVPVDYQSTSYGTTYHDVGVIRITYDGAWERANVKADFPGAADHGYYQAPDEALWTS